MYVDVCEYKGEVHAWERDEEGTLSHISAPIKDYLYLFVRDNTGHGGFWNMQSEQMKQLNFNSRKELTSYAEHRTDVCEGDVPPAYRFIQESYVDAPPSTPIIGFYDIETDFDLEDGHGYPTPTNPFGEINSLSLYNDKTDSYVMFIPDKFRGVITLTDTYHNLPLEIFWCSDERDLLMLYAQYLDSASIDVLTAWNGAAFDIAYIMARSIKIFGIRYAETMYCRNGIPATSREFTNLYGELETAWTLKGRTHIDMMLLFKKFNPGELKSFALANVCEHVLGETKIDFEDDLGSLYRENPQRFYEYSLHDARLLKLLNDKTQIMQLAGIFAAMNGVLLSDVLGAVKSIEFGFMKFCRKKNNIVLPSKKENESESFPGAIVYDTIEGRHDMMMTADLGSLYPSVMILLGLSPETYIMQLANDYEDYIKVTTRSSENVSVTLKNTGEDIEIVAADLMKIITDNGYVIAGSGAIFSGELGLLAEFVQHGVNLRKTYQKLMRESYGAGDTVKGQMYNGYQNATKVLNNSIYGASGQNSFRLYDVGLSKAITLTAQVISKFQANKANECINALRT